ncbi:MAG: ribosome small subunit-dependent GTPase A [Ruminococcus sp.]|nr:ribosome small subunit-dependent GTPase A [Ruminococcus sp.]
MNGIIIKAIGGIYTVEAPEGVYECKARGIFRKNGVSPLCGDKVEFSFNENTPVIEKILDRKSVIIRPPLANLDVLVFVVSTCEPQPNLLLLDKFIAVAEHKNIEPIVVFTKIDKEDFKPFSTIYEKCGIKVFQVDNISGIGAEEVKKALLNKISAFTGNTGVGKSSLLNNIFPELNLATNEISQKLGRGKHTTRHVQLYKLQDGGYIADTPGFSSFDTNRYDIILKDELAECFVEFRPFFGKCKFQDCSHTKENGCAVIKAVCNGDIPKTRHDNYIAMYEDAKHLKEWEHR